MEPLFFKAENRGNNVTFACAGRASMEPLFFKAENIAVGAAASPTRQLQWSRFFSKRKTKDLSPNGEK